MRGFGEVAERLRRSTVQVFSKGHRGGGSGVVWDSAGLIVTNAHVARSDEARVELWDGRKLEGRVTSRDQRRDLAVLRIPGAGLEAAPHGDSDALRPGELVIAVGSPLGFAGALSTGVVHSIGELPGMGRQRWIRADVRLAPGNSGGPLADAEGRVIGINTAIVNGLGVAVPSNAAASFLRRGPRPALGVVMRPVSHGLLLLEVRARGARCGGLAQTRRRAFGFVRQLERRSRIRAERPPPAVLPWRRLLPRPGDPCPAGGAGGGGVIRLLIAAESAVVRAGLEALVASSPGVQVLGSFPDCSQVEALRPDVVLAAVPSEDLPADRCRSRPADRRILDCGGRPCRCPCDPAGERVGRRDSGRRGIRRRRSRRVGPSRPGRPAGRGALRSRSPRIPRT